MHTTLKIGIYKSSFNVSDKRINYSNNTIDQLLITAVTSNSIDKACEEFRYVRILDKANPTPLSEDRNLSKYLYADLSLMKKTRTIKFVLYDTGKSRCYALHRVRVWGKFLNANALPVGLQTKKENNQRTHTSLHDSEIKTELPEEFIDPITCSLMRDPVVLESGKVVDRSTIVKHLITNQTDPFTGLPTSLDLIYTDIALKIRIDNYLAQSRLKSNNG